ncbi:aldose epimerase family protein [Hespellia stercorisuis]|uniref:Aldose 1-epimerase n=1 Tax=Hespellia stercorisuis DSM 15480 TaxID=1121950 RepID=A0A1M6NQB7_9FIRM|nr:aldose epimerase family protein [Hespellia stercorisuis]SHJ97913.1 aldose 1-epimerase [Hespellia stercorisuis DSM 15480]
MKELVITDFGKTSDGKRASLFTLTNNNMMYVAVSDYGASLVRMVVPDVDQMPVDVVLGYDKASGYEAGDLFFGGTIGRCANRVGGAVFAINGTQYQLDKNDNENNLHSGMDYYNKRLWEVRNKNNHRVTFTLHSADGDQGFPGTIDVEVTYELTEDNELKISYFATPNVDTIINMTNHSYFNLNGHASGDVLKHQVAIDADYYTETDKDAIPTGRVVPVAGTPMNFKKRKEIGRDIGDRYEALVYGHGYDHNYVLKNEKKMAKVAVAVGDRTAIKMEVYTDLPGMQFYTANYVDGEHGKEGAVYQKRSAFCFETQFFPDAIHHIDFDGPICRAGENYTTSTVYKFVID